MRPHTHTHTHTHTHPKAPRADQSFGTLWIPSLHTYQDESQSNCVDPEMLRCPTPPPTKFPLIVREIRTIGTKMFKCCLFFKNLVIIDHIFCFQCVFNVFN